MSNGADLTPPSAPGDDPRAPLGHLSRLGFALRSATSIDEVAASVLADLASLPEVVRVGFALTEGGGRRLRYVATDTDRRPDLTWGHIDSYDDVPLTAVVRSGEPVLMDIDALATRFSGLAVGLPDRGAVSLAAWPMPGTGSPIGGIVVLFDRHQDFTDAQQRLLEAAARRAADAVRRVRITSGRGPDEAAPDDPALIGEGRRASVLLEGDPRAPGGARRFLRETLAAWEVGGDAVETAQLCLSELVTNVVMHARTTSELTLHLEHAALTVVVRDLGGSSGAEVPASVPAADEDPLRVYGRGLMLVDALADRWGSERDDTGTTAWFVLELDGGSSDGPAASSSRAG
ncbi:MAG: ATP-binding protein [Nocardioides sp.]